ncbi:MAG: alpha/beta fold hydrolase [Actinomycetota bacterium]
MEAMELAYEERGSGPALVFVHGFPLDRTLWIPQLAGLAKRRTCVAIDLRGHGLSATESLEGFSMDMFADDIAATLDGMQIKQADFAGLSMGGYVLFSLWRRHRARVRSLIFIDTKAEADSPEAKDGREKTAEMVARDGMEALHDGLGPKMFGDAPADQVPAQVKRMFMETAPEVAAADLLAMRDRTDSTDLLAGIDVPVLWMHGEQDKLMPIEGAAATAARIPGAKFVAIPNAGHVANLENPEAVIAAIGEFLPRK